MRNFQVRCKHCNKWVDVDETEFIDISEDFQGYDLMKFKHKKCGTVSESRVTK